MGLKSMLLGALTGGMSLGVSPSAAGSAGGAASTGGFLTSLLHGNPAGGAPPTPGPGAGGGQPNLLSPNAGVGEVFAKIIERQKQQQEWMGNPINRLGATFGFSAPQGKFTAEEMFGTTAPYLTDNQRRNLDLANSMTEEYQSGLLALPGKLISSAF